MNGDPAWEDDERVPVVEFDYEEVIRRLDGLEEKDCRKEIFRVTVRAVLDALLPRCARRGTLVTTAGRNAVLMAFAVGHHSVNGQKVKELAKLVGLKPKHAERQLSVIRRRAGIR